MAKTLTLCGHTFEINNSSKMKEWFRQYLRTTDKYLWDCYSSYSAEKEEAYNRCVELANSLDVYDGDYYIVSYNKNVFTFGFEFINYETEQDYFVLITRDHNYIMELS